MLAVALTAVVLLGGCSSENDNDAESAAPTTSDTVTLPVSVVTTTLLDPGSEPRQVIAPTVSDTPQSSQLVTESTVFQQIGDQDKQDFSTPAVTLPLTATSSSGDGNNGAILTDLTLGTPTSPDATLQSALEATAGSHAGFVADSTGAVSALRIDPAEAAQDIARSAVEQALNQAVYRSIAFPTDPVGPGATWTLTQEVVSSFALQQVTTVTLNSITDGVAARSVSITQTPQSQQWELPDEQGTLDIDSFVLTGTGSLTIDPTKPLPLDGSITVGGDQSYRDPNSATILRQTTTNSITWSSPS